MVQVHHRPTRVQRLLCWALVSQLASLSAFAALDPAQREACQVFTTSPNLSKCPAGTIYVSAHDPKAKFNSIQKAIDSLKTTAATTPATILIGSGQYQESLAVDGFGSITLLGQTTSPGSTYVGNTVDINHNRALQKSDGYENWLTATLRVDQCSDFKAYNLNVRQTAQSGIGLAVAVMTSRASFYAMDIEGRQDTLFLGPGGTLGYVYGCRISGMVDFVYGWGTLIIKNSQLALTGEGTAFVAWRGEESRTSGIYIFDSSLDKAQNPSQTIYPRTVAAGRPWSDHGRIMLFSCYLGDVIRPEVFAPWSPADPRLSSAVVLAEYNSRGPGSTGKRKLVPSGTTKVDPEHLSYILDQKTASLYTLGSIFTDGTSWLDLKFDVKALRPSSEGGGGSSTAALAHAPALAASLPPPAGKSTPPPGGKAGLLTKQGPKKRKSKHHSEHKSKNQKTTSNKPKVGGGAGGPSLASLPKRQDHGLDGHKHHHSRHGRKHHHH